MTDNTINYHEIGQIWLSSECNIMNKQPYAVSREAKIIKELVLHKFDRFFKDYWSRSLRRKSIRRSRELLLIGKESLDIDNNQVNYYQNLEKPECISEGGSQSLIVIPVFEPPTFQDDFQCAAMDETFENSLSHAPLMSTELSVNTSRMSSLISSQNLSNSNENCVSLDRITENESDEEQDSFSSLASNDDDEIFALVNESAIQIQIIQQTIKAIAVCRSIKEFQSSPEQLEAERILLTASCHRDLILKKLKESRVEYRTESAHRGSVRLSNFYFAAKSNESGESPKRNKGYTQWFVCIVSCGTKLFSTDPVTADPEGDVYFDGEISFDNLKPDFEIVVNLYGMKLKNSLRNYSHESKYHLNKHSKMTCPSPTKLFNFRRRERPSPPDLYLRSSRFVLWGTATIRICDLDKLTFQMRSIPLCSTLSDEFSVTLNSRVKMRQYFTGFLNVCSTESSKSLISWNKRWCTLHDSRLELWSDPCEADKPLQVIDLRSCANSRISKVDRSVCARPRCLLLENKTCNSQIISHFLQADTTNQMRKWEQVLNAVITSLRMWRCMHYSNTMSTTL